MTLPYDRKFTAGRQSEQLYNEELHKLFESLKHINETPEGAEVAPDAKIHGALWRRTASNELKYYDKPTNKWVNVFADKFQIVDQLLDKMPPGDPVYGQLWICNGVLMYFDGAKWEPIKALLEDGSQVNLSAFEDFLMISPLNPSGDEVVDDTISSSDPYAQFLLPNINIDRYFVTGNLKHDYKAVNSVCLQYPTSKLAGNLAQAVHVNPGKITDMKKRIIKVNKDNPLLYVPAFNTEYYGFIAGSSTGRLLQASNSDSDGDYVVVPEGIYLNYSATRTFDYVLSVTYSFDWFKSAGRLTKSDSDNFGTSYYIGEVGGPLNIFIGGYDLENRFYDYDSESQTINLVEDAKDLEVSVLRSSKREYGFIRDITADGRGIIKTLNKYVEPLVFVNGEAMHPTAGELEFDGDRIYVLGAKINMEWSVVELDDIIRSDDMFYSAGVVTDTDTSGTPMIKFDNTVVAADDGMVLFINGLIIKKEDIVRDQAAGTVTTGGLLPGMEYILLKDKYHNLYKEESLVPAIISDNTDESLVYLNGDIICNSTALVTTVKKEDLATSAANGEMKLFIRSEADTATGEFCVYDMYNSAWVPMDAADQDAIKKFVYGYENSLNAIKINIPYTNKDFIQVYAYTFANRIEHPLIVRSFLADDENEFLIDNTFIPNIGSLSVWVNGIRQYYVKEYLDGSGFELPMKVTGKITYIVEHPESGEGVSCVREILTKDNVMPGTSNVYKTTQPLFPGRVTVYIDGLRQPKECFAILDDHTILFKDSKTRLIGGPDTFPEEKVVVGSDIKTIRHDHPDEILLEIRQEYKTQEQTILWDDPSSWDISVTKYDLPIDILEATDEILIFIDGIFTGLRANFGYRKDIGRGCIALLAGEVVEVLITDPLYKIFMTNPDKYAAWRTKNGGITYVPNIKNKIILEWR